MRRLIATITAALALSGVGLATNTTSPDAAHDTSDAAGYLLPYVEQENLSKPFNL